MSKELPLGGSGLTQQRRPSSTLRFKSLLIGLAIVSTYIVVQKLLVPHSYLILGADINDQCAQPDLLQPFRSAEVWEAVNSLYDDRDFGSKAVQWLGDAVRIPTESYDDFGPLEEDDRWQNRGPFVDHLPKAFPLAHKALERSIVNKFGLLYEWKGKDSSLKPILLMGHYDVVPVAPDTIDDWAHPPFTGHFDGENIWGRGSSDDKSGVIGILITIETLIEQGWTPTRTIILSFGFDEEIGGSEGAVQLSKELEARLGRKSLALIIDEGSGYSDQYGATTAVVAIGERGSTNLKIEVRSPGGHSSVPPVHTTIGYISQLVVDLENNPFPVHLVPGQPTHDLALCLGAHGPNIPSSIKKAIARSSTNKHARSVAESFLFKQRGFEQMTATTQAVDIVQGGVKSNALPELATAIVNHRIATDSSIEATKARDTRLLKQSAHKLGLNLTAFGEEYPVRDAVGSVVLSIKGGLDPAPVASVSARPYEVIAGSIRAAHKQHGSGDLIVAPGVMSGNTDTNRYWNLSDHIFRYNHHDLRAINGAGSGIGVHTVNEHISLSAFLEQIRFFTALVLNADEANLD